MRSPAERIYFGSNPDVGFSIFILFLFSLRFISFSFHFFYFYSHSIFFISILIPFFYFYSHSSFILFSFYFYSICLVFYSFFLIFPDKIYITYESIYGYGRIRFLFKGSSGHSIFECCRQIICLFLYCSCSIIHRIHAS